ncbi:MAG TPA: dihydroneopterin aldolase [Mucilaginibacter sp.]
MMKIAIHGAKFFAHHGFYPEEQKLGNCFVVDIEVGFEPTGDIDEDKLTNTVNYEQLHTIATLQMQQPRKLIETVAQAIMNEIKSNYPELETIDVIIKKINPPMGCEVAYSSVTINYTKHHELQ